MHCTLKKTKHILDQDYFIFKHHQTRPVQFQHNRFIFLSWTKSRVEIVKIKQTTFFKQLGKAQWSSLQRLGLTVSLIQITGMNTNSKCNLDLHLQIWQPLVVNFLPLASHCISLNNVLPWIMSPPPWIVSPFLKKLSTQKRNVIQMLVYLMFPDII